MTLVARLFANMIIDGRTEKFVDVPRGLRERVAEILIKDFKRPDLVPENLNGTMTTDLA